MPDIGGYADLPLDLGGGISVVEVEHQALLDAYAPAWDTSEGTANYAEAWAHAIAISMIWAINDRLRNQAIPERMLESVATWEQVLKLRPTRADSDSARRSRIAAKLRGLVSNTLSDIAESCRAIFGDNFDAIVNADPANATTYWPGMNPGPPGFEWSSDRCRIGVRVTRSGMTDAEFRASRQALADTLDAMIPAWMSFSIGVGSEFIVNVGIVGQDFI